MVQLAACDDRMVVGEFLQFLETRPDEEKWELLDGMPVMNAAPVYRHQRIVFNLLKCLGAQEKHPNPPWVVIPGIGVRVSDYSLPVPDVMVVPPLAADAHYCDNILAAFEVLSPSTKKRDLTWKRKAYAGIASVQHYVIIIPEKTEVLHFRRTAGWQDVMLAAMEDRLEFPELRLGLKLSDIYFGLGY